MEDTIRLSSRAKNQSLLESTMPFSPRLDAFSPLSPRLQGLSPLTPKPSDSPRQSNHRLRLRPELSQSTSFISPRARRNICNPLHFSQNFNFIKQGNRSSKIIKADHKLTFDISNLEMPKTSRLKRAKTTILNNRPVNINLLLDNYPMQNFCQITWNQLSLLKMSEKKNSRKKDSLNVFKKQPKFKVDKKKHHKKKTSNQSDSEDQSLPQFIQNLSESSRASNNEYVSSSESEISSIDKPQIPEIKKQLPQKRPRSGSFNQENYNINSIRKMSTAEPEIFAGNFPKDVTEADIQQFFQKIGTIEEIKLLPIYNKKTKGRAFISFESMEQAYDALELNGTDYKGNTIQVNLSAQKPTKPRPKGGSNVVFIGNLPFDTNEDEIGFYFERCGDIIEVRLAYDTQNQFNPIYNELRGFGHIEFKLKESADKAIQLSGKRFKGRVLKVTYATHKQEGNQPTSISLLTPKRLKLSLE